MGSAMRYSKRSYRDCSKRKMLSSKESVKLSGGVSILSQKQPEIGTPKPVHLCSETLGGGGLDGDALSCLGDATCDEHREWGDAEGPYAES